MTDQTKNWATDGPPPPPKIRGAFYVSLAPEMAERGKERESERESGGGYQIIISTGLTFSWSVLQSARGLCTFSTRSIAAPASKLQSREAKEFLSTQQQQPRRGIIFFWHI